MIQKGRQGLDIVFKALIRSVGFVLIAVSATEGYEARLVSKKKKHVWMLCEEWLIRGQW